MSSTTAITITSSSTTCTICSDEAGESLTRLPCGHTWCATCLHHVFTPAHLEINWPPSCCNGLVIPLSLVAPALPPILLHTFGARNREFETPARSRTYCANLMCAEFVPMEFVVGDVASCPACSVQTCVACKAEAHEAACVQDQGLQETLELAVQEGWQRCGDCGRVVERNNGCPHMTCYCGNNFCYHCGGPIHICNGCPWTEQRLTRRDSFTDLEEEADFDPWGEELPYDEEDSEGEELQDNVRMIDDMSIPLVGDMFLFRTFADAIRQSMRDLPQLRIIRGTRGSLFQEPGGDSG